jgi:hypothetical protein
MGSRYSSQITSRHSSTEEKKKYIYIRAPDWWPDPVQERHALMLMKSRQWHVRISTWMEQHGYLAVSSVKTKFMKRKGGKERIMHGQFVDDMSHASMCEKLKKQFLHEYKRDFDTKEGVMSTFLRMEVKQTKDSIKLHLDTYIQETIDEYKSEIKQC